MNSFSSLLSKKWPKARILFYPKKCIFLLLQTSVNQKLPNWGDKKVSTKISGHSKVLDAVANNLSTQLGINAQYISSWWKECMVLWQFVSTCFINFIQTQFKGYFEEVIDFQYWSLILVCFLIKYYQGFFFLIEI